MSVDVYAVCLDRPLDSAFLRQLHDSVSDSKKEQAARLKRPEDAWRTLTGDLLARYAISRKWGLAGSGIRFTANGWGKPFAEGWPHVHFNVSHSGEWVVCAVSEQSVGIDVEQIVPIDMALAKRYFSREEEADLFQQPAYRRLSYFYDLWTLKESYVKQRGMGLSLPLDAFSIRVHADGVPALIRRPDDEDGLRFKQYPVDGPYKLSVCALESAFAEQPAVLSIDALLHEINGVKH
jgi:4'-phosphopantetheinyl transferase